MKKSASHWTVRISCITCLICLITQTSIAESLRAGAAKVDVTNYEAGPVNDPLHVRALVVQSDSETAVIITVDAVAIGEIGPVKNDYLPTVRESLQTELGIKTNRVIINASHCHGKVAPNVAELTVQAVKEAYENLAPVRVGVGTGHEDRISENRRLILKDGKEADVRHAYSLPADDDVAEVGPIDPQIGILKIDREDGRVLAVVYNFAMHPIQSVPGNANTADVTGYSSKVIEDNLDEGTVALFVQGCGGDINPINYKDVDHPRHAEPLGNMLGLSTLLAVRKIKTEASSKLNVIHDTLTLPRGDRSERITQLEAEQRRLSGSIRGTSLNLKTFLPLVMKYNLSEEFPSYYSHRYLHDDALDRKDLRHLDAENRSNIEAYINNIQSMEKLSRVNTNLRLLNKHQASLIASGKRTIDVELNALQVGKFKLLTFPGELTVRIGLNIKKDSGDPNTFVAGYTNGYIYYAPTAEQLLNVGGAQEDSDCILAPEWQKIFEEKALEMLKAL
ncbi:hypothetical protein N8590_02625 [bacterium]|nr:hypothetical protein [bacterium]MDB4802518.1 hypothetical protein [bacterium]